MIENKPVKRTLGVCRSLVAIVLLGAALRFLDLGRQSVWIDEGFSWLVAQTSFGELTRLSWTDTHPPLYYCLLKISLWVLPDTELGIRVVSALCSIATLVVLIIFVYRHWGQRAHPLSAGGGRAECAWIARSSWNCCRDDRRVHPLGRGFLLHPV